MLQEHRRLLRSKRPMAFVRSVILLVVALSVFPPMAGAAQSTQCEFDVVENTGDGYLVGQPLSNVTTTFNFVDSSTHSCSRFFTVDSSSAIRTRGNLDREEVFRIEGTDQLNCILRFRDPSTNSERQLLIAIHVLDVNDETPRFFNLEPVHIISILESIGVPNPILSLQPVDNDKGPNGTVVFNITQGNEMNYFRIERPIGDYDPASTMRLLTVVKSLDFERERLFNLTVTITDMGTPVNHSFNQTLIINVTDSNDERPHFIVSSYQFAVPEDHPLDLSIGNTTANDPDSKGAILYTIYSNPNMSSVTLPFVYQYIRVDVHTGDIYLTQHIDYDRASEELKDFTFYVQAQNPGRNAVTIARVQVEILDTNDERPYVCFRCPPSTDGNLTLFVEENDPRLPQSLPTFRIRDDDSSQDFQTVSNNISVEFVPAISTTTTASQVFGNFFVRISINQTLDRETTPHLTLFITAYNTAEPPLNGTSTIFITVTDTNDNAPQFMQNTFHGRISESSPIGKEILTITAQDEDAGENGTISFAVTAVDKPQARGWFAINQSSGRVSVNTTALDYNLIDGRVTLTVTATDHGSPPLSNTTRVEITISPAITFVQRSYQKYSGYNILEGEREHVYLEFRTTQTEGLLLYQAGAPTKAFTLKVEGGKVRYRLESGGRVFEGTRDTSSVSNDRWHSVEVERRQEEIVLSVWVTDQHAPSRLENSTLAECRRTQPQTSDGASLYVGGVDLFALPSNATQYMDFVGSIRNVIIGSTQLDLECPSQEENAILGFHRSSSCENVSLSCIGAHTTGCVDYAPQPYCSCLGGFDPQACQQENSYAPIKFQGDAKAEISLGYSFFYDLATVDTNTNTNTGAQQRRRRRRRRSVGGEEVLQTVEISFRPVEVGRGILLYSQTQTSIHVLKIEQADENEQTIIYNVFDIKFTMAIVNVPLGVRLSARALYTATITITNSTVTLSLRANGTHAVPPRSEPWGSHSVTPFAQPPQTLISIGGAPDTNPMAPVNNEHFSGCISLVSINHIELPLSGLLNTSTGGGLSTVGNIEASCDLCNPGLCSADMQCVSDQSGSYECQCPAGQVRTHTTDNQERCAVAVTTTLPNSSDGLGTPSDNGFPFYYIIASCVGGLVVVGVCVLAFVLLAKCGYSKYEKKKRTYHFGSEAPNNAAHNAATLKPNFYTTVIPKNSDSETSNQDHSTGSMSTYHEHDIPDDMVDTEVNKPPPFSRRRSTISAESGIKTDTDRDDRSTGGFPRMEDSGNEKDTDYSPPESESDDVLSSCMETVLSPSGVNLVGSTSSVMGIPIHVSPPHVPLTPKERKALTPLRPDSSAILSMSEMDGDTDMEAYKRSLWPPRAMGNRGSNSEGTSRASPSEPGTPKWYKSSTASDTEREKIRALRTRSYYPPPAEPPYTRSPPTKASPPSAPAGYKSPPVFMYRKHSTPSYSSQRPYQQSIDSPLSRSHKQICPSGPHSPHSVQLQQTPELLSKSQPNRFCYPSCTAPHRQLSSPPLSHHQFNSPRSSIISHRQPNSPAPSSPRQLNSPPSATHSHHQPNSPRTHPSYMFTSTSAPYHSYGREAPTNQEQQFQDLKSVARINPISYWEMQDRMKSTVDQVDVFSEPYNQFEDVSTNPSIVESQMTFVDSDRPEHQAFSSEGGGEGTADLLELSLMQPDDDTLVTDGTATAPPIQHFPSADCSEQYTRTNSVVTLIASSANSNSSPKRLSSGLSNGFVVPSSQEPFAV